MMNEYPTSARSRESACNKIGGDEEKPGSCNRDPDRKPVAKTSKAYEGGSLGPTTVLVSNCHRRTEIYTNKRELKVFH